MRKIFGLFCLLAFIGMATSCSDDDDEPELTNGSRNLKHMVFQFNSDGNCSYDGTCPTPQQMNSEVFGHGWQTVGVYEIDQDGHMSTSEYYQQQGITPSSEIQYFNPNGTVLTHYHEFGYTHDGPQYFSYRGEYNDGFYFIKQYDNDKFAFQALEIFQNKHGETCLAVLKELYQTHMTGEKSIKHYGVEILTKADDDIVKALQNQLHYNGDTTPPDSCKFNIKIKEGERAYAPFEKLHLELTDANGTESLSNPAFCYFDSITCQLYYGAWSQGYPCKVFDNKWKREKIALNWTNSFYSDKEKLVTEGWKDGQVIYKQMIPLEVKGLDFMCYNWADYAKATDKPTKQVITNMFIPAVSYTLVPPCSDGKGHLYSRLYTIDANGRNISVKSQQGILQDKMKEYYYSNGKEIVKQEDVTATRALFHCLPETSEPVWYWKTRNSIVVLATDPNYNGGRYFLHAEPRED